MAGAWLGWPRPAVPFDINGFAITRLAVSSTRDTFASVRQQSTHGTGCSRMIVVATLGWTGQGTGLVICRVRAAIKTGSWVKKIRRNELWRSRKRKGSGKGR